MCRYLLRGPATRVLGVGDGLVKNLIFHDVGQAVAPRASKGHPRRVRTGWNLFNGYTDSRTFYRSPAHPLASFPFVPLSASAGIARDTDIFRPPVRLVYRYGVPQVTDKRTEVTASRRPDID